MSNKLGIKILFFESFLFERNEAQPEIILFSADIRNIEGKSLLKTLKMNISFTFLPIDNVQLDGVRFIV